MADKNNMSYKASKTCFGVPEVEFFGHILNIDGRRHADHHLAPFRNMVPPENISELRRVLGLFVQHKDAIPNFGIIARPLHDLTIKGRQWQWRADVEHYAFEALRDKCLQNDILATPDFTKQFFVDVDASDSGKGVTLYQLTDPSKGESLDNRSVISYYSKAHPASFMH